MILRPLLAALLAVAASPSFAEEVQLAYWEHGSWRVALVEDTQWNMRSCRVWTGGDGNGTLALHVGDGGADASFSYEPVTFRNIAPPMTLDDEMVLMFDGQESWIADELTVSEYYNDFGDFVVDASLSNSFVSETVKELRAGNTVIVGVRRGGAPKVFDTFLLNGFTATWLKASEWCRFNAGKSFFSS